MKSRSESAIVGLGYGIIVLFFDRQIDRFIFVFGCVSEFALAFTAQVRNEMFVLIPVCMLVIVSLGGRTACRPGWWPATFLVLLLLPLGIHIAWISHGYEPGVVEGIGTSVQYFGPNFVAAAKYVFHEPIALACMALAVFGLFKMPTRKTGFIPAIWVTPLFLIPMFHFGGSYSFPGGSRFFVVCVPPLALSAGIGLSRIYRMFTRRSSKLTFMTACVGTVIASLFWTNIYATRQDRETAIPRKDCLFLRSALQSIPENAMVITSDPPAIITEGRSAYFITLVDHAPHDLEYIKETYRGRLYYFTSPSSLPEQWPGGRSAESILWSEMIASPLLEETGEDGVRGFYVLTERTDSANPEDAQG